MNELMMMATTMETLSKKKKIKMSEKRKAEKKRVNKNQQVNENYNFYGVFDDTQLLLTKQRRRRIVYREGKS